MTADILNKYQQQAYVLFRVVIGVLFTWHGLMKFGVLAGSFSTPDNPMMLAAGIFEVIIGPTLILGLLTRPMAALGAVEMVVAIATVHVPAAGFNILSQGGGETAYLFLLAFILIVTMGAGIMSLDRKVIPKLA